MNLKYITLAPFILMMLQTIVLQAMDLPKDAKRTARSLSANSLPSFLHTNPKNKPKKTEADEVIQPAPVFPAFPEFPEDVLKEIMENCKYDHLTIYIRKMINKNSEYLFVPSIVPRKATHQEVIKSLHMILSEEPNTLPQIKEIFSEYIKTLPKKPDSRPESKLDNNIFYVFVKFAQIFNDQQLNSALSMKMWKYIENIDLNLFTGEQIADALTIIGVKLMREFDNEEVELLLLNEKKNKRSKVKQRSIVATLFDETIYNIALSLLSADEAGQRAIAEKLKIAGLRLMKLKNAFGVLQITGALDHVSVGRLKFVVEDDVLKSLRSFVNLMASKYDYIIPPLSIVLKNFLNISETNADPDMLHYKYQKYRISCDYEDNELSAPECLTHFFTNIKIIPEEVLNVLSGLIRKDRFAKEQASPDPNPRDWQFSDLAYFFKSWDEVDVLKRLFKNNFFAYSQLEELYEGVPESDHALMLSMRLNIKEDLASKLLKGEIGSCVQKAKYNESMQENKIIIKKSGNNFENLDDIPCNIMPLRRSSAKEVSLPLEKRKSSSESVSSGELETSASTSTPKHRNSGKRDLPRRVSKDRVSKEKVSKESVSKEPVISHRLGSHKVSPQKSQASLTPVVKISAARETVLFSDNSEEDNIFSDLGKNDEVERGLNFAPGAQKKTIVPVVPVPK